MQQMVGGLAHGRVHSNRLQGLFGTRTRTCTYALHLEKMSILYGTGSILPSILHTYIMRLFRWAGNLRQGKPASR